MGDVDGRVVGGRFLSYLVAVVEVPDALHGMGREVAEVEGEGRAAFPESVGEGDPVDGVFGHFPAREEEGVVEVKDGVVVAVALVDGLESVDDNVRCVVGDVVVEERLTGAKGDGVVVVVAGKEVRERW